MQELQKLCLSQNCVFFATAVLNFAQNLTHTPFPRSYTDQGFFVFCTTFVVKVIKLQCKTFLCNAKFYTLLSGPKHSSAVQNVDLQCQILLRSVIFLMQNFALCSLVQNFPLQCKTLICNAKFCCVMQLFFNAKLCYAVHYICIWSKTLLCRAKLCYAVHYRKKFQPGMLCVGINDSTCPLSPFALPFLSCRTIMMIVDGDQNITRDIPEFGMVAL